MEITEQEIRRAMIDDHPELTEAFIEAWRQGIIYPAKRDERGRLIWGSRIYNSTDC